MTTSKGTAIAATAAVVASIALGIAAAAGAGWTIATPGYAWSFPRDHWSHPGYRTEWWYFTGHLEATDDPSARFGFQFTLFRIGLLPDRPALASQWASANLVMGHAAITDLRAGSHRFSDVLRRETPLLGAYGTYPDDPIGWVRAPAGTQGRWAVRWNGEGFDFSMRDDAKGMAMALSTRPLKRLVYQGPGGLSRKGSGTSAASLYYSFTRLATAGTLTVGGRTRTVTGTSWMDKEFGSSQLSAGQVGWDWFSLQLADGREAMLYVLRREDGTPDFRSGTLVGADGSARYLAASEWTVAATSSWKSEATGATYPAGWKVEIPSEGLRWIVTPRVADQENVGNASGGIHYWEGAVGLTGDDGRPLGEGYVELTGYGAGSRPPI